MEHEPGNRAVIIGYIKYLSIPLQNLYIYPYWGVRVPPIDRSWLVRVPWSGADPPLRGINAVRATLALGW